MAWFVNRSGERYFLSTSGLYWKLYNGCLIPAVATQFYIEEPLSKSEMNALLRTSRAYFIRYSSSLKESQESEWWYIVCNKYDKKLLSKNTRSKVNRGNRNFIVKKITYDFFINGAYSCYESAFSRYLDSKPMSEEDFIRQETPKKNGPFEWWGVFDEEKMVGYCECIVEEEEVSTNIIKFNPDYLKKYSSYALFDVLLTHYINRNYVVSNGHRSVSHDTNMQDYLVKFGFRKQYCKLHIHYQSYLKLIVIMTYPFRKLIRRIPKNRAVNKVNALLSQEAIRRSIPSGEIN